MMRTRIAARLLAAAAVMAAVLAHWARTGTAQIAAGKACELLTVAELQAVLGRGVKLAAGSFSDVATCRGEGQKGRVVLQLFKEANDPASSEARKAGIDAVERIGMQVNTSTSGGITCTTMAPPAKLAHLGFTTTCTVVSKAPMYARVEIIAKTQNDMIQMDTLRELAMKMTDRF
jgi:hypothetical protein